MKKSILNLGRALEKGEQKNVNGGDLFYVGDKNEVSGGGVTGITLIGPGDRCSDGSVPTYTCLNNSYVGYCLSGEVIMGPGGHCA